VFNNQNKLNKMFYELEKETVFYKLEMDKETVFYEQEKDKAQEQSQIAEYHLNKAREYLNKTEEEDNTVNINRANIILTNAEYNFITVNKLFHEANQNYIKQLEKEEEDLNSW